MQDWVRETVHFTTSGDHTLKWTYKKDDMDYDGEDCLYLDGVVWTLATDNEQTKTTPVPVRHDWLLKYPSLLSLGGGSFESAAMLPTGKKDVVGNELLVWHDYVAGTDPTNTASFLTSKVEMIDGMPRITWNPDLKGERIYKIWGSTNLVNGGDWECPTNALHRFFKVTVEMVI